MNKTRFGMTAAALLSMLAFTFLASCGSSSSGPTSLTITVYHLAGENLPGVGPTHVLQGSTDPQYIGEQWHITNANLVERFYKETLALPPFKGSSLILGLDHWTLYTFQQGTSVILQGSTGPEAVSGLTLNPHDERGISAKWLQLYQQIIHAITPYVNPTYTPQATPSP